MSTDDLDREWDRVSENPQNMIVSDSLRGMLDLDDEKNPPSAVPKLSVSLGFDNDEIDFELLFYAKRGLSYEFSFLCKKSDAFFLMNNDELRSVSIVNSNLGKGKEFKVLHSSFDLSFELGSDKVKDSTISGNMCLCSIIIKV